MVLKKKIAHTLLKLSYYNSKIVSRLLLVETLPSVL
jgi:hypothetical protein